MKRFTIISDSSCDLIPSNYISELFDFFTAPITINTDQQTFIDDEQLNTTQLVLALSNSQGAVKTACPSPQAYIDLMQGDGDVICLTLSSKLSGSFNSANIAMEQIKKDFPQKRVFVLDSLTTSSGLALILLKTFELINQNCSYQHICETLKILSYKTQIRFLLQDYTALIKSGRISKLAGLIASVLIIKTVCGNNDGEIKLFNKVIGTKKGLRLMCNHASEAQAKRVVISHHLNATDAQSLKDILQNDHKIDDITILPMRGTASCYAGEKGITLAF